MNPNLLLSRLPIDPYIAAIVGMVGLASLLPVHGAGARRWRATRPMPPSPLLFFLHGAQLAAARGAGRGPPLAPARRRACWPPSCCSPRWAWPRARWRRIC